MDLEVASFQTNHDKPGGITQRSNTSLKVKRMMEMLGENAVEMVGKWWGKTNNYNP